MTQKQAPPWAGKYPLSYALGVSVISTSPGIEHPGADEDEVAAKLGASRYANFQAKLMSGKPYSGSVFSVNHRKYTAGPLKGYEAHGVWFEDLELFLRSGG